MQLTKRQHYVPQCYLKQFSAKYNEKVDYFDKVTGKSFTSMHVENVAQQRYYYDFSEEFVKSYNSNFSTNLNVEEINIQFLEKYFSKLETGFGNAFLTLVQKINDEKNLLTTDLNKVITEVERQELSFFMALQSIRTPSYRELLKNFVTILEKNSFSIFDSIKLDEIDENELFFYYLDTGVLDRLANHFNKNFNWSLGIITNPEQARFPHIRKMFVTDEFLISDNRVINFKHINQKNHLDLSLEFAIPITHHHIIILRDNNYPQKEATSIFEVDRNQVRIYNEYQYRFSKRFVFYSKSTNKSKVKNFFKYNPEEYTQNNGNFCVLTY